MEEYGFSLNVILLNFEKQNHETFHSGLMSSVLRLLYITNSVLFMSVKSAGPTCPLKHFK